MSVDFFPPEIASILDERNEEREAARREADAYAKRKAVRNELSTAHDFVRGRLTYLGKLTYGELPGHLSPSLIELGNRWRAYEDLLRREWELLYPGRSIGEIPSESVKRLANEKELPNDIRLLLHLFVLALENSHSLPRVCDGLLTGRPDALNDAFCWLSYFRDLLFRSEDGTFASVPSHIKATEKEKIEKLLRFGSSFSNARPMTSGALEAPSDAAPKLSEGGTPPADPFNHLTSISAAIPLVNDTIARMSASPSTPTSNGPNATTLSKGGTPLGDPFVPLTSWNEILAALNEPHDKPEWKNDEQTRAKIRRLNIQYDGPIKLPDGKGKQPSVDKSALLAWWNKLREQFDARLEEAEAAADAARLTVTNSHNYGTRGEVVPGIAGSVKSKKGKERKG